MRSVEVTFSAVLIADEEGEVLGDVDLARNTYVDDVVLEAESTSAEPLVLAHSLDEDLLSGGRGLVLGHEVGEEGFEFLGVLFGDEVSGVGREAMG